MRRLSKSKLIAFRQCPKRLWLEVHRPELRDDSASEMVFRIGNEVGEAARHLYDTDGTGTVIDIAALGYAEAFRLSGELLQKAEGPVFEAGLSIPGALAFADVMLPMDRDGDDGQRRWRMIEVKSTTGVKDYHRDDLAIQTCVATEMGVPLESVRLAHIDNTFVYPGGGDYRGLLAEVDLTEEAEGRLPEVRGWIADAQTTAALPDEPEIEMGPQCHSPFDCPFAAHCGRDQIEPEYPLTSLPRLGENRRTFLEAEGYTDLREVPDEYLNAAQQRVKQATLSGEAWFDAAGAADALAPYGFPARFLDFETVMMPVPIWPGTRPYQQIPFQFSLHRLDEDGTLHHEAFLDLGGDDPSGSLARALVAVAGESGPVFAYNAKFERMVIHQLAARFPEESGPLLALADRLVDLYPIAKAHYYHPSQHGRWSLKALLPAVCPDLTYGTLEGVADGGMAVTAYREAIAPETTTERRAQIERELLAYCHLDTLALVRVWAVFRGNGPAGILTER
ncbi:MAG TPA: DUF2779 domain-containing protein [Bacteroidia bacterium]|nr:DUF2779 domain-containing protein [Bacteroidia bacterium]